MDRFEEIKYFIGFVSALSGLFSEQAFNKLNEISETLFGRQQNSATAQTGQGAKRKKIP